MGKWALLVLLVLASSLASALTVQVVGTTATQAVLSYTAPDTGVCTVEVSESSSLTPLVHDVNPAIFAGAQRDDRTGSLSAGTSRIFVVGKKTSDTAADGRLYSRALQTNTVHYYRVICSGQTATGQFTTMNLPIGNTYPEIFPFNDKGFGNYAWPSIDWTDRSKTYIDPMTGIQLKRVTSGEDLGGILRNKTFNADGYVNGGGAWSNPQNAAAGSPSVLASTTTSNQPLFLPFNQDSGLYSRMLDAGVRTFGYGTSATPSSREIKLCLSIDSGQTCYTPEISLILPQGSAQDAGVTPRNFPAAGFAGWNKTIPLAKIYPMTVWNTWLVPRAGTGNIINGIFLTTGNNPYGQSFNNNWKPGTKIWIENSAPTCAHNLCTIESVQNTGQITLAEKFTKGISNWKSADFGVRVIKSGGDGSVAVSFNYDMAWSHPALPWTDNFACSRASVTTNVDANGNPLGSPLSGNLCLMVAGYGNGPLYFVGTNGEVRLISILNNPKSISGVPAGDQIHPSEGIGRSFFDPTQGNVLYTYRNTASGRHSLFRMTYTGDYRAWKLDWEVNPGTDVNWPMKYDDKITWTNINPPSQGLDIESQVAAKYPAYNTSLWGSPGIMMGVTGDYAITGAMFQQDTACWIFLINVKTGQLELGFNSWEGKFNPNLKWSGCHSFSATTGMFAISTHALNHPEATMGGPYEMQVTRVKKSGVWSADTTVPSLPDGSYDSACPADIDPSYTAAGGSSCVTVKIAGPPCKAKPVWQDLAVGTVCPTDASKAFLQDFALGDYTTDANTTFKSDPEVFRIVKITKNSATDIDLVLQRVRSPNYYCGNPFTDPQYSQTDHKNGWKMHMTTVPNKAVCFGGTYGFTMGTSPVFYTFGSWSRGHASIGVGDGPGQYRIADNFNSLGSGPLSIVTQDFSYQQNTMPPFAGVQGLSGGLQAYPNNRHFDAPLSETKWKLDNRHVEWSGTFSTILLSGTTSVYVLRRNGNDIFWASPAQYKTLPIVAYAGSTLLKDKSSPVLGNTLTDADAWRFCFAYKDGECRTGSRAGDMYMVVPASEVMNTAACPDFNYAMAYTPCAFVGVNTAAMITQNDISRNDPSGSYIRALTTGLTGPGRQFIFAPVGVTNSGKYVFVPGYHLDGYRTEVLLAKMPPFPASDGIDRTTFIPAKLTLIPPAGKGVANAVVEFGYAENGRPDQYFCTGRQETCVARQTNSYTDYSYASEPYSGVPCTTSCAVTVPVIPQRVAYYRVNYRDANNAVVAQGNGIISELSSAALGGAISTPAPTISCGAPGSNAFTGCYYNGTAFQTFAMTRTDPVINFEWSSGSPSPTVAADSFSVRWEGDFTFEAAEYVFTATTDDGTRLYIDNQLVNDKWIDRGPTTDVIRQSMTAGTHRIRMEYFDSGALATAKLSWSKGGTPGDLNGDGRVNILDIQLVTKDMGKTSGFDPRVDMASPFGAVDLFDVMSVVRQWTG
jgi:hypothetical protein